MTISEGRVRISRGPERCNNCHISQPPVDTKLPWPPPAPLIIQLDNSITTYLQNEEKVFRLKHVVTIIAWQRVPLVSSVLLPCVEEICYNYCYLM